MPVPNKKGKSETLFFNDGIVTIYTVKNSAASGDMPIESLEEKAKLRFENKTVGFSRFFVAKHSSVKIDYLIRTLKRKEVKAEDVAIIDGEQYQLIQVQYPENIKPPVMDLTLERLMEYYEIAKD